VGKDNIAFSALSDTLKAYLSADEHSPLKKFYYDRLLMQVNGDGK
jgi:hypothetical protein